MSLKNFFFFYSLKSPFLWFCWKFQSRPGSLAILHSHVYLFCTWPQPSIESSAEPVAAAPPPGVLQSPLRDSSPGDDKMMTKCAKMYIQYVWQEWVPDTYSATFPTYETLPPAVATDPVVLLILHIAVYIPHTCPLATGINRYSSLNLLLSYATRLLTLTSWKSGSLNWEIMQGLVFKPLRWHSLPRSHRHRRNKVKRHHFQQPAPYMSLIFCSSGHQTAKSFPNVKAGIKKWRKAPEIHCF